MDRATAEKLLDHTITSIGEGEVRLYQIANGEWVCRVRRRDFWLWSFEDLHTYVHELKAQGKQQRKAPAKATKHREREDLRGIEAAEAYHLVMQGAYP